MLQDKNRPSKTDPLKAGRLKAGRLKAGRKARFIYIYMPDLGLHRTARQHNLDARAPLALYETHKGADRVRYCNDAAASFGLTPDMSLSDARALCALCHFYETDDAADKKWLIRLARWCWRYSPVVGIDTDRLGLWIDSTGADHLWGGEAAMLDDMASQFATPQSDALPITAHIVIASSYGAALGIAISVRPDTPLIVPDTDTAHHDILSPLPLYALRLTSSQIADLAQIGISIIGDLSALQRGMVAMRFGEDVIMRRDQMFGLVPERPHPLPQLKPVMIQQHYHEPIGGVASLEAMVASLLDGLSDMLSDMLLACRMIEIGWRTIDGQINHIAHNLSRPSRDKRLFHRLFQDAATTIDAGFGIEYSWVKAGALNAQMPQAMIFDDTGRITEDDDKLSQLVDHLTARLGTDRVQRLTVIENWIPEASETFISAQSDIAHMPSQPASSLFTSAMHDDVPDDFLDDDLMGASPRPMRLLSPPEAVQAIALLPDHPPSQIRWRKQNWRIRRATGPERIGPRWWQAQTQDDATSRDYYRLETEAGNRLWVYRSGLPERGEACQWYLHGLFA